ncbi:hypothetical protein KIH31_16640 [Paenarthrobacter sp. DKR-5]|uniref:hypothetical protein n=1 Tax=Paenarthrobacter sp. DKR-5 TaxID=2835535 RepID=UPI001BDD6B6D|nr:hypothetical protein [Paenarthrobacter sp. DKR-5]MBT1004216.1 hypothetical protein [Paenarthrobacter sp. DKR-5]
MVERNVNLIRAAVASLGRGWFGGIGSLRPADGGRAQASWLDPDLKDKEGVQKLLLNIPEPHLVLREVDKKVGSALNNGARTH